MAAETEDIYDVIICGGGIAGLATGYELYKASCTKGLKVLVLEGRTRLGGRLKAGKWGKERREEGEITFILTE